MSDYQNSELWVGGKLYDTREMLKINDNYKLEVIEIDSQKIVVIDDFYSNPDILREVALNSTATRLVNCRYPGYRTLVPLGWNDRDEIYKLTIKNIMKKVWDIKIDTIDFERNSLCFNLQKAYKVWPNVLKKGDIHPESRPHVDRKKYNSLVYLNKDNEWSGVNGTGIYRHKETGLISSESIPYKNLNKMWDENRLQPITKWMSDTDETWKLEHLVEMKYNRLTIYDGYLFHAAYMNSTDFVDVPRIVQPNFIKFKGNRYVCDRCRDKL